MMMMEDDGSFATVLQGMQGLSTKRDPRSIRLAAVTAAMTDVVGENVSAAKVYASTVSALEGTLQQGTTDSVATQVALLELLRTTVPHVSSAAIGATLSVASRVLRAVVTSSQTATDDMGTKDELGGINVTLRGVIRASCEVLKRVGPSAAETTVRHFYQGTILKLFEDRHPTVRKPAHNATWKLLQMETCHASVQQSVQSYARSRLEKAGKDPNADNAHLLHLLSFLERCIVSLDPSIHDAVMELLMIALQSEVLPSNTSGDYVDSMSRNVITPKILLVNGLLSVLLAELENDDESSSGERQTDFSSRVLASLLQGRPLVLFASGSCDDELIDLGRTLYGRALLVSCQAVFESQERSVGCKFLPLTIQMVLQLSRPSNDAPTVDVAQTLMVELTRMFRVHLSPIMMVKQDEPRAPELNQCLQDSLRGMEQVLHHSFRPTWSVTLQACAFLIHLMQDDDHVSGVVESLIQLHRLVVADSNAREAVESAVRSLVQGVGIEKFWKWVTWKDLKNDTRKDSKKLQSKKIEYVISAERVWLLPSMKTSSMAAMPRRPSLAFFQDHVLNLARKCDAYSAIHTADVAVASFHRARVVDLWSLFPCFCQHPSDLEKTFPVFSQTLIRAMGDSRYPQLVVIICGGLRILASDVDARRTMEHDVLHVHNDDASVDTDTKVIGKASTTILPSLFKLLESIHGTNTIKKAGGEDSMDEDLGGPTGGNKDVDSQRSQSVIETIASLASLTPKPFLQGLFKKVMQRLLAASQSDEAETPKVCTLLELCQALVTSRALDDASISLLCRAIKPLVRTDENEARVQKRAYKVLLEICKRYPSFVTQPERLGDLTSLLLDSIMTSQVSARHLRLKCMTLIVQAFDDENPEYSAVIAKIVPEMLLCLKESNGKAREAGYQLLITMAGVYENKTEIFRVVIAALGAQTPHMRSAAVMAMSRLVFEYAREDGSVYDLLPSLLQTVIVLFDEDSREVTKSVIGFVRVSVVAMTAEQLEPLLPELVGGLLKFHKGKGRFRAKIKIIVKKLVRMYGYDRLMPLVPASDTRLLTHMRKLSERAARRKAAQQSDDTPESNQFDDLMESDEDDSDDGRTLMTGATGFTRMTGRTGKSLRNTAIERSVAASTAISNKTRQTRGTIPRLRAETNGEVMDMLDPKVAKSVHFAEEDFSDDDSDDNGVMEFDDMGRLVVPDETEGTGGDRAASDDEPGQTMGSSKRQRVSKFESAKVARDEAQKKKSTKKQVQSIGAAYKSKKSGGDVKKKGQKYEPYAYVPLDGRNFSKKHRRDTVERMSTVVRTGGKRKRG